MASHSVSGRSLFIISTFTRETENASAVVYVWMSEAVSLHSHSNRWSDGPIAH